MIRTITALSFISLITSAAWSAPLGESPAAHSEVPDSLNWDDADYEGTDLDEIVIIQKNSGIRKLRGSAFNTELMTSAELTRAACCNLGESFSTNPSVDVSYSDAATGARQIKLLGLPGTYVQMLTENIPNLRGASAPYGLGYIPGPWMQSIQVSKGASSVKNGYESVTGQINVEFLKPQTEDNLLLNGYADHQGRVEANAVGNLHFNPKLSSALLLHGEHNFSSHDSNDDGFADSPKVSQFAALNRWAYMGDNYIVQGGLKYLGEKRQSGQLGSHAHHAAAAQNAGEAGATPYIIDTHTDRLEAFLKNAYIFDHESNSNLALILSGTFHDQKSDYGRKIYDVIQRTLYGQLMYERDFGSMHSISAGLSLNIDDYRQHYRLTHNAALTPTRLDENETVAGGYVQYTFNYDSHLMVMGGLRYDHSSRYGSMFTPRLHARWNIADWLSLHASAGKGYRTPYALADNNYLLASSREIVVSPSLKQEEAWNFGGGGSGDLHLGERKLIWSAEYYYTDFRHQTVVDLDYSPQMAIIREIGGKSYSHSVQVEAGIDIIADMTFTAAYRFNDVKVDYGRGVVEKPLTSKSKGLFSLSYAPMMGLWQFDATLAINGGGRMPDPGDTAAWQKRYKAYPTLNAQATRNFRHWSIYIGGENLTNYRQKHPIIGAADPWGPGFDSTMVYAPVHGAMVYVGFRYNLK